MVEHAAFNRTARVRFPPLPLAWRVRLLVRMPVLQTGETGSIPVRATDTKLT